jgi:hypothetical protein
MNCNEMYGQRDIKNSAFHNFANEPKNGIRRCALDLPVSGHVEYKWRGLVNAVMKPRIKQNAGNFLTGWIMLH